MGPDSHYCWSFDSLEVDEPPLHVRVNELHPNPVAYVDPLETVNQLPLDRRVKKVDPRAFGGGATGCPAIAAFSKRCVTRSGYRRLGAVEWV